VVAAPLASRASPQGGLGLPVLVAQHAKGQHEEADVRCGEVVWYVYDLTPDGSLCHPKDKEKIYASAAALPHSFLDLGEQQAAKAGHWQCAVERSSQLFHARQTVVQHLVQMYV
jgi:hypothetical protein